jgi:hypothetical protein
MELKVKLIPPKVAVVIPETKLAPEIVKEVPPLALAFEFETEVIVGALA